jgi:hypothetical protein
MELKVEEERQARAEEQQQRRARRQQTSAQRTRELASSLPRARGGPPTPEATHRRGGSPRAR